MDLFLLEHFNTCSIPVHCRPGCTIMNGHVICCDASTRFIGRQMHCTARSGMTNSKKWDVVRPMAGSVTNGSQKRQERQNKLNGARCSLELTVSRGGWAMRFKKFESGLLQALSSPHERNSTECKAYPQQSNGPTHLNTRRQQKAGGSVEDRAQQV